MIEHKFKKDGVIHVIQCKPSANKKIGMFSMVIQTYHFSEEQFIDFKDDAKNCLDCPYSYNMNGGKTGGCYTHSGMQGMGLRSMLRRLKKLEIPDYDKQSFNNFVSYIKQFPIELCRLGAYGEPCLLPLRLIGKLVKLSKAHSGYTHQWGKEQYKGYSKYLMASTHNMFETAIANDLGFRAFESSKKMDKKMPMCPAAKEFKGKSKTCVQCAACCGTVKKQTNNIFIFKH